MALNSTFQKQEKPTEEKKLEAVQTLETTLDELVAYFERSVSTPIKEEWWDEVFEPYKRDLKSFKITPEIVSKVNLALPKYNPIGAYGRYLGYFLSALIQTSYDQGHNNFEFEEVSASCFCYAFKGKKENPLMIKIKKLDGWNNFSGAENFFAEIEDIPNGYYAFNKAKNFSTKIQHIKGAWNFADAKFFSADIQHIEGQWTFGGASNFSLKTPNRTYKF